MNHKQVTNAQTVNACTLISIAVIEAILLAENEKTMENAIRLAQDLSEQRYRQLLAASDEHGDGLLETDAYQRFFLTSLTNPQTQELSAPINLDAVRALLANRDDWLTHGELNAEFYVFNLDAIEAIERQLPAETPAIEWATITENDLTKRLNPDAKSALSVQADEVMTRLKDSEGMTLRMEGHTISVVRRKNIFYSYDSLTGILSSTATPHEMGQHITRKIDTNHANALILHHFSSLPSTKLEANQNCAEMMLKKAAQIVLNQDIDFHYSDETPDVQVDIGPAFLFSEDRQKQLWVSGGAKHNLEADLNKLDKAKVYFLRTGVNEGAGHWQTLYFDSSQNGWVNYSSPKNNYLLTHDDKLTTQGLTLLSLFAKWGVERGQYSMLAVEASPQNIIKAANFLYDYRTQGEAVAQEKAWENKDELYEQIAIKPNKNPQQASELAATKLDRIINELKANISHQANGRQTTRNSHWKSNLLTNIQQKLLLDPELSSEGAQGYIEEIRNVCAMKRNVLHFWAEPHSVKEFESLLQKEFKHEDLHHNPKVVL